MDGDLRPFPANVNLGGLARWSLSLSLGATRSLSGVSYAELVTSIPAGTDGGRGPSPGFLSWHTLARLVDTDQARHPSTKV